MVESVACLDTDGSQQRVAQLFKFLNALLLKDCQTARRLLYFSPPSSIPLGTKHRLIASADDEIALIHILHKVWLIISQYILHIKSYKYKI